MPTQLNMVKTAVTAVASSGLGAFTIGSAAAGFRTFTAGQNGQSFTCQISEGSTWEIRSGCVYTSSGTTLSRGTLEDSSSGSAIAFTAACIVRVVLSAAGLDAMGLVPTTMRGRIEKLKRGSYNGSTINPRILPVMSTPPTITTGGTVAAGLSNDYPLQVSGTIQTVHPFDICGGYPYIGGAGQVCFPCQRDSATTGGNIDNSGRRAMSWRVRGATDAAKVSIGVVGFNSYRFLVDDGSGNKYVSLTPTAAPSAGGMQFITLDFGSKLASGRIITIESNQGSAGFSKFSVLPTERVWLPPQGDRLKVGVIGDSICAGTGATILNNAFSCVMGDFLGAVDVWQMGLGGTGYISAGTSWKYQDHITDWTSVSTNWDLLVFTGGNNDVGQTQAAITAAVTSVLTATRAALPNVPIVVFGPDNTATGPSAGMVTTEAGIKAGVLAMNDSTIQFIPLVTLPEGGSEVFGTGYVGATNGSGNSDFYTGTDGTHPPDAGHLYRGVFRAARVRASLANMVA